MIILSCSLYLFEYLLGGWTHDYTQLAKHLTGRVRTQAMWTHIHLDDMLLA